VLDVPDAVARVTVGRVVARTAVDLITPKRVFRPHSRGGELRANGSE
jgi:hypothetical protein